MKYITHRNVEYNVHQDKCASLCRPKSLKLETSSSAAWFTLMEITLSFMFAFVPINLLWDLSVLRNSFVCLEPVYNMKHVDSALISSFEAFITSIDTARTKMKT